MYTRILLFGALGSYFITSQCTSLLYRNLKSPLCGWRRHYILLCRWTNYPGGL